MITTFLSVLFLATTFEPPAAKVSDKYFTQDYSYIVECNDQSRHIVTKSVYDTINIGDTCPSE